MGLGALNWALAAEVVTVLLVREQMCFSDEFSMRRRSDDCVGMSSSGRCGAPRFYYVSNAESPPV